MWVCDICGSHDIQIKDWMNVNDDEECTDLLYYLPSSNKGYNVTEYNAKHRTYCLACEQTNEGVKWKEDEKKSRNI